MNCIKIIFTPKMIFKDEGKVIDSLEWYLSSLYNNGQILKDYVLIKDSDGYAAFITLTEEDALDKKYNNAYISKFLDEVSELFEIYTEIIGNNLFVGKSCNCIDKPEWYMLYTDWTSKSPVICGICEQSVPLYKLPYIHDEKEYYTALKWDEAYYNVHSLYINGLEP